MYGIGRGTTPTIVFHLPFDASTINNCEVYFSQNDFLVLEKKLQDLTLEGNTITTTLSQEETLKFSLQNNAKIAIQLRFVFTSGDVDTSTIVYVLARKLLKSSKIEYIDSDTEGGDLSGD